MEEQHNFDFEDDLEAMLDMEDGKLFIYAATTNNAYYRSIGAFMQ